MHSRKNCHRNSMHYIQLNATAHLLCNQWMPTTLFDSFYSLLLICYPFATLNLINKWYFPLSVSLFLSFCDIHTIASNLHNNLKSFNRLLQSHYVKLHSVSLFTYMLYSIHTHTDVLARVWLHDFLLISKHKRNKWSNKLYIVVKQCHFLIC